MYRGLTYSRKAVHAVLLFLLVYGRLVTSDNTEVEDGVSDRPDISPSECVKFTKVSCPQNTTCSCVSEAAQSTLTGVSRPTAASVSRPKISILCCNVSDENQLREGIGCASPVGDVDLVGLHIRNSTVGIRHISEALGNASSLSSLAITDGVVPLITAPLSDIVPSLSCLNLSNNGLGDLSEEALRDLHSLRALDLSANNVTRLPRLPLGVDGRPLWIDISGNDHLVCVDMLDVMSRNATVELSTSVGATTASSLGTSPLIYFHNKMYTSCLTSKGYGWFSWIQKTPLVELENRLKLKKECPSGDGYSCDCDVLRFEFVPGRPPSLSVSVDCSGLGLSYLPDKLPQHTTKLNVSNNNILSLEPLGRNKYYSEIREFDADNNLIASIEVLEGSEFLSKFQSLSLSGNKLKELPMYLLKNVFERSMIYMKLGKNKYNCDCNTYHELKAWVLQNKKNIHDTEDMVCDDQVPPVKIIDLQKEKVCLHSTDWMDYLPIVVIAEVFLLIALVTKVTYDYWIFKTTGYLPWPASQTPRLPCCDWALDA